MACRSLHIEKILWGDKQYLGTPDAFQGGHDYGGANMILYSAMLLLRNSRGVPLELEPPSLNN